METKILHSGFDGLELAICARIPADLERELAEAKEEAQKRKASVPMPSPVGYIMVNESGAKGGYTYSCVLPGSGNWFFKKPGPSDPWGIRFSSSADALLLCGLDGLRERVADTCDKLNISVPADAYRISRVDFAVDFLAPGFVLDPDCFVIHSRTSKKTIAEFEGIVTNGSSSRVTSVTLGKMPGRQAIIYDKRAEVLKKGKAQWPLVWGRALHGPDAPPLDLQDRNASQVWRIEIRAAKRCLKDTWFVEGWHSLYNQLPKVFDAFLKDVRYCVPNDDSNRARWPVHPMWADVHKTVADGLFGFVPKLSAEDYREVIAAQKIDELLTQAFGLIVSAAAIESVKEQDLASYAKRCVESYVGVANRSKRPVKRRIALAGQRFAHVRKCR